MRKLLFLILALPLITTAQRHQLGKEMKAAKAKGYFKKERDLLQLTNEREPDADKLLKTHRILKIKKSADSILQEKPEWLTFKIPGRADKLLLKKAPNARQVLTASGAKIDDRSILNYRGALDGDETSLVSFTITPSEITALISDKRGNRVIGKMKSGRHIEYDDNDLLESNPLQCSTPPTNELPGLPTEALEAAEQQMAGAHCVTWWWETDYDIYTAKGGTTGANTYMQAVFNQVATLYANDGLTIKLGTLFIWDKEDPYIGPTSGNYLTQFGTYRTSWPGCDLAHLIGIKGGGGVAYVNGIVFCNYNIGQVTAQTAYSGISTAYSTVPTYSWTVGCISHEQGHQLGLNHTHDCVWPTMGGNMNRIDNCGQLAGYTTTQTCPVRDTSGPGTIMSYCHLRGERRIDFTLGFGAIPLQRAFDRILESSGCLNSCDSIPSGCTLPGQPGAISGPTGGCTGLTITLTAAAVPGATGYAWTLPAGWAGTSNTNTITLTVGTNSGQITVKALNACGAGLGRTTTLSATGAPATPGYIIGSTTVAQKSLQTYQVPATAGISNYKWTLPAGWTGSSTTNTIQATVGTTGGTLQVQAIGGCGTSAARTLFVSTTPACTEIKELRTLSCPAGQTGAITQQRVFSCATQSWGDWYQTGNTCRAGDTTLIQIKCAFFQKMAWSTTTLDSTSQYVKAIGSGYTNYNYKWTRTRAGVTQAMGWTKNIIYGNGYTQYQRGDILTVTIGSTNPKTLDKWWKPCTLSTTVR